MLPCATTTNSLAPASSSAFCCSAISIAVAPEPSWFSATTGNETGRDKAGNRHPRLIETGDATLWRAVGEKGPGHIGWPVGLRDRRREKAGSIPHWSVSIKPATRRGFDNAACK